jgi:cyclophilin family peptidyl-prolyl cis-trans isomerase/HEAT repeat protein
MKRYTLLLLLVLSVGAAAQVPLNVKIQIAQAEDARRYDKTLKDLMKSPNAEVRKRAALAAGRIGREEVLPALIDLLENDPSNDVETIAAFAIGEVESINAADAIVQMLRKPAQSKGSLTARLVEAAGKIAAANQQDPKAKDLGKAILDVLKIEDTRAKIQDTETVLLALTAALRARPEGGDAIVANYLTNFDARVRADAANTLARIRAKNANETLRKMVASDADPIVRANAARALGAAEDKDAVEVLTNAAIKDVDSRVRVSAIRSLAALRDARAADHLLERGETLLRQYKAAKQRVPDEKNELLEIAVALGRVLANSDNQRAVRFLAEYTSVDGAYSSEIPVARVRVSQSKGDGAFPFPDARDWHQYRTLADLMGELAVIEPASEDGKTRKAEAPGVLRPMAKALAEATRKTDGKAVSAAGDVLRAFARFKTDDLNDVLLIALANPEVATRAAAAGLLADRPGSKENVDALKAAFAKALLTDKQENDAQIAILNALSRLDKKDAVGTFLTALSAPDFLVRRRAFELLADKELQKDFPGVAASLENARKAGKDRVLRYNPASGTKLGQVLNTDADYRRALARKNGSVKAVVTTEKGAFTIEFYPEDAPLTVDNFIKLARSGYFNGNEVHRVVPNFVIQDGDPTGTGSGGPGWSIRCEVNMRMYGRGVVGMALSGKDTGGSQWFVTHSPQPHLDGGYTIFGRVSEKDMKVVDRIVRGDRILTVRIIGR